MPGKTNKSVQKRFKLTKSGKLMRKHSAGNHFNARKSSSNMRQKRKKFSYAPETNKMTRLIKSYLPSN